MSKLPILMYHNVSNISESSFGLTISSKNLEKQFAYLVKNNYSSFHLSELENLLIIPKKSIVITFDDCTSNQLELAVPLLKKYNLKATFFIPFSFIGKSDSWNDSSQKIMNIQDLQSLDKLIELGMHSYNHQKFDSLTDLEINQDFDECYKIISQNSLNVFNAIAYPFGNYPKNEPQKSIFFKILKQNNIAMALKIGNRINNFPFPNPFEINRIDILGQDRLWKFKLKLIFGKLKLF